MTFKCTLIVQYTTGSEDIKGVNLFEPNVSTSANVNRLIGNQNLVSDWGFLYTGIRHGKYFSLFQFKYNHVQGMIKMIKMHSVCKKHSIHYFSEVTWDLAQLLIHIMNTDFIFDIHFHNIMLWQYLTFRYHKIVAKIFITQYVNCEIRCVIWNIKLI